MKKLIICLSLLCPLLLACDWLGNGPEPGAFDEDPADCYAVGHDQIVLGDKLEDPYTLANMRDALDNLYGTRALSIQINATDIYVRFLPKNWEEYEELERLGLKFFDHPLDYKILKDGDYYHDPSVPEEEITWQYSVVRPDFVFPESIEYEVLDECFVPTEVTVKSDDVDWAAVEREAFRITGNEDLLPIDVKGSNESGIPRGNISIIDENYQSGKPLGVAGVRVQCNSFVKVDWAYTDENGDYVLSKTFSSNIHYRLVFSNEKGFGIGMNLILLPASYSTLGKNSPSGVKMVINNNSERKLFSRCVVNNAAYDYFRMCEESSNGEESVNMPPSNLRIWLMQRLSSSCAPMLQQGPVFDRGLLSSFLGDFKSLLKSFLPDVILGLKWMDSYEDIYSMTVHELSHASHYERAGNAFWDKFIGFILSSFVFSGGQMYGEGVEKDAGYCEVGEMWSYYMENKLFRARYGTEALSSGTSYWFSPQILAYLDERGIGSGKICHALEADVNSAEKLRDRLEELYPSDSEMIRQAFNRYGK